MRRAMRDQSSDRAIAWWLILCAVTVFAMVVLGGVTRLTGSGLSMVDWRPILGAIPPLTDEAWQATFEQYKQFPEYQKVNSGMDVEGFKSIFWLEYLHRLLGRFIGLLFALPFAYFLWRGQVRQPLTAKLAGLFVLGGLQGLMGWYMVKSGLVDDPNVSQYRLTAHLSLAIVIIVGLLWVAWDLLYERPARRDIAAFVAASCVLVTMLSGGFVAGTDAGLLFGTWPLMGDNFVPAGIYGAGLVAAFEDPVTIQFNHRMLAYATTGVVLWFAFSRWRLAGAVRPVLWLVLFLLAVQVLIGISTILLRVPVPLAAAHQAVGLALLLALAFAAHRFSRDT